MWRHENSSHPSRIRSAVDVTSSYEHFHCHAVTVAVTWPGAEGRGSFGSRSSRHIDSDGALNPGRDMAIEKNGLNLDATDNRCDESPASKVVGKSTSKHPVDDGASSSVADENLPSGKSSSPCHPSSDLCIGAMDVQRRSAWGLVIVTAGRGGVIRVFQNFGFPVEV
jgi:WD repeat-containing protein 44